MKNRLYRARDIIAEWINENIYVRKQLRRLYLRKASITTKVVKSKKEEENAQKINILIGRTFDKSAIASIISDTSCRKYGFY
jgi:transcriptional accessory protein Tex/SPT6